MLPAAQGPQPPERGVVNGQVAAVAFPEDGPFDVGRLELAAPGDRLAVRADYPLRHVQASLVLLAVPHDDGDAVVLGRLGETLGLGGAVTREL